MMNKTISTRSLKSVKSVKSMKSGQSSLGEEKLDIGGYLISTCAKFNCGYEVTVVKEVQRDDFFKRSKRADAPVKYKKITVAPSLPEDAYQDSDTQLAGSTQTSKPIIHSDTITVTATYDRCNNLVELSMFHVKDVPRVLMQAIGLLVPYFDELYKISIKKTRVNKYTIYELQKMLLLSTITEICLDESPLPEANYAILLDGSSRLRSLSLCRCLINDDVCRQIAARLHYLEPSETTLGALNLSSNHITDVGAEYIGMALRTNRHLRYLNLADNCISDDGANHIFNVLVEFPLTSREVIDKRRRFFDYLKTKQTMFVKFLNEFDSKSVDEYGHFSKRSTVKKKGKPKGGPKNNSFADDCAYTRAEMMTEELVGPYLDPYGPKYVKLKNDRSHCMGNLILCYLNLSYNHLTYLSIKKLLAVVHYQQLNKIKTGQCGLMKLLIDGNYMPVICNELSAINDILQKSIGCFGSRTAEKTSRRKSTRIYDNV